MNYYKSKDDIYWDIKRLMVYNALVNGKGVVTIYELGERKTYWDICLDHWDEFCLDDEKRFATLYLDSNVHVIKSGHKADIYFLDRKTLSMLYRRLKGFTLIKEKDINRLIKPTSDLIISKYF